MAISNALAKYGAKANAGPPSRLGQRYNATRFLPEAGNTVVCHLDRDHPSHAAVLEARRRLQSLPGAEQFLYTPVESLHMTVFEGVIETRRTADAWPADMDRSAAVSDVTDALLPRLRDFTAPPPFAVRAIDVLPTGLILTGATREDEQKMQAWREALTEPFGYRREDHDAYWFHMTFAYPTGWIREDLLPLWAKETADILTGLTGAAPVIPLNAPAFCAFADMTHFEELLVLER